MARKPFILDGASVLIVEDEYLIASDLSKGLTDAGAIVVGPVPSLEAALATAAEAQLDVAVVDVNLRGAMVYPLIDKLLAQNVPVVLATGYDAQAIPPRYTQLVRCEKPVSLDAVKAAIVKAHELAAR